MEKDGVTGLSSGTVVTYKEGYGDSLAGGAKLKIAPSSRAIIESPLPNHANTANAHRAAAPIYFGFHLDTQYPRAALYGRSNSPQIVSLRLTTGHLSTLPQQQPPMISTLRAATFPFLR
jgi:hypothetical protein